MDLLSELRAIGWYLSEGGLKKVTPYNENIKEIIKLCLDTDFREIAEGALSTAQKHRSGCCENLKGPIVLQVQSIRNIAAPKTTEKAFGPRMLCIELSDGQSSIRALELQRVSSLDLNTPPGTKIHFRADQLELLGGYLLLKQPEVHVLGGNVANLVEKWEVARTMQMYARNGHRLSGFAGPPPWLAFGKSLNEVTENSGLGKERDFKSLQMATEKDKDNKENEEFNAMRNEAIAEAAKAGTKKIFGGGGQQILDHNIKKILDKGYSEEEARQFLRATNNNLERALYNLKRRLDANKQSGDSALKSNSAASRPSNSHRENGSKKNNANKAEEIAATKPAANVSLFDFLTDKLPTNAHRLTMETKPVNRTFMQTPSEPKPNSHISNHTPREQRNHQQSDAKNLRNSETRLQSGRPTKNDDSKKNEQGEKNGPSSSCNSAYNKQNGREGGVSNDSNRNSYDHRDANNRRYSRNERNGGGNSRKVQTVNNSQQTHEINSQLRNSEGRLKPEAHQNRPNLNRNQQRSQQQQYNNNGPSPNTLQKQTYSNQRPRHQTGTKQSTPNHSPSMNVKATSHHLNNYPNTAHAQAPAASTPTLLSNGFVYDPSKIIGFQSKEANEYAMSLMRSQGKTIAVDANQSKPMQPHQQPVTGPIPQPPIQFLPQPVPLAPMPAPMHVQAPGAMPLPPHQFAITSSMPTAANDTWNWKVGDFCMAKYWDDGQYYDAEITGISDKTCVVYYINYGNHEEVLKTDCLPITDAHHRPINNYNLQQKIALSTQPQHQRAPMRYYVPPHNRNN